MAKISRVLLATETDNFTLGTGHYLSPGGGGWAEDFWGITRFARFSCSTTQYISV